MTVATEPLSETPALSRFETDVFVTDSHLSARRGSSSSKERSYCYAKSYVLSCSFGRSCPRVYLYADVGTKSRIPTPCTEGWRANTSLAFWVDSSSPQGSH